MSALGVGVHAPITEDSTVNTMNTLWVADFFVVSDRSTKNILDLYSTEKDILTRISRGVPVCVQQSAM